VVFTLAGLWPYTTPTPTVTTVLAEAGMPPARESVSATLHDIMVRQLVGALTLADADRSVLSQASCCRQVISMITEDFYRHRSTFPS
jgi:hypothetical protein